MKFGIRKLADLDSSERAAITHRSEAIVDELLSGVKDIVDEVKEKGDAALIDCTARFDGVDLRAKGLRVTEEEFTAAERALEKEVRDAVSRAVSNVTRFHELQLPAGMHMCEVSPESLPGSGQGLSRPPGCMCQAGKAASRLCFICWRSLLT